MSISQPAQHDLLTRLPNRLSPAGELPSSRPSAAATASQRASGTFSSINLRYGAPRSRPCRSTSRTSNAPHGAEEIYRDRVTPIASRRKRHFVEEQSARRPASSTRSGSAQLESRHRWAIASLFSAVQLVRTLRRYDAHALAPCRAAHFRVDPAIPTLVDRLNIRERPRSHAARELAFFVKFRPLRQISMSSCPAHERRAPEGPR